MFVLYALVLALLVHNTVRFIWKSDQLRSMPVMMFYILIFLVVMLRVAWLSIILKISDEEGGAEHFWD